MTHTPLCHGPATDPDEWLIYDSKRGVIAKTWHTDELSAEDWAALIVKAVNHHDELAGALDELLNLAGQPLTPRLFAAVERGRAILDKLND